MSGMVYIEIACTGEKRQHTEASLLKRLAILQQRTPKEIKKSLSLLSNGEILDLPRATFRRFSGNLDDFRYIPQAMETGAWGALVPSA